MRTMSWIAVVAGLVCGQGAVADEIDDKVGRQQRQGGQDEAEAYAK